MLPRGTPMVQSRKSPPAGVTALPDTAWRECYTCWPIQVDIELRLAYPYAHGLLRTDI